MPAAAANILCADAGVIGRPFWPFTAAEAPFAPFPFTNVIPAAVARLHDHRRPAEAADDAVARREHPRQHRRADGAPPPGLHGRERAEREQQVGEREAPRDMARIGEAVGQRRHHAGRHGRDAGAPGRDHPGEHGAEG